MSNLLTRLARAAGRAAATKSAPATVAFYGEGRPVWMARDPAAFAQQGYRRNAIAHRCVRLVAEAAAALPLTLAGADDAHPLTSLLARPNPREGGTRFLEGVYGHLMVSGNAALWSKCTKGVSREGAPLWSGGNWLAQHGRGERISSRSVRARFRRGCVLGTRGYSRPESAPD